jgi:DNA repair protein RadC
MKNDDQVLKSYQAISKIRLVKERTDMPKFKVMNSDAVYDFAMKLYPESIEIYESFYIILLDRSNKITAFALISQGGISGTVVDPKLIFKYVCDFLASGLVLVHNHPSGEKKPSEADIRLTEKIKSLCTIMDVNLLDHLIVTADGYFSFADKGLL